MEIKLLTLALSMTYQRYRSTKFTDVPSQSVERVHTPSESVRSYIVRSRPLISILHPWQIQRRTQWQLKDKACDRKLTVKLIVELINILVRWQNPEVNGGEGFPREELQRETIGGDPDKFMIRLRVNIFYDSFFVATSVGPSVKWYISVFLRGSIKGWTWGARRDWKCESTRWSFW